MYGPKVCQFCKEKCSAKSPLHDAHPDDEHGGLRPWAKYIWKQATKGTMLKFPSCKVCQLCMNTYRALGRDLRISYQHQQQLSVRAHAMCMHYFVRELVGMSRCFVENTQCEARSCIHARACENLAISMRMQPIPKADHNIDGATPHRHIVAHDVTSRSGLILLFAPMNLV